MSKFESWVHPLNGFRRKFYRATSRWCPPPESEPETVDMYRFLTTAEVCFRLQASKRIELDLAENLVQISRRHLCGFGTIGTATWISKQTKTLAAFFCQGNYAKKEPCKHWPLFLTLSFSRRNCKYTEATANTAQTHSQPRRSKPYHLWEDCTLPSLYGVRLLYSNCAKHRQDPQDAIWYQHHDQRHQHFLNPAAVYSTSITKLQPLCSDVPAVASTAHILHTRQGISDFSHPELNTFDVEKLYVSLTQLNQTGTHRMVSA